MGPFGDTQSKPNFIISHLILSPLFLQLKSIATQSITFTSYIIYYMSMFLLSFTLKANILSTIFFFSCSIDGLTEFVVIGVFFIRLFNSRMQWKCFQTISKNFTLFDNLWSSEIRILDFWTVIALHNTHAHNTRLNFSWFSMRSRFASLNRLNVLLSVNLEILSWSFEMS